MARERMITRTVERNIWTVMTCNTTTAEVRNETYTTGILPGNKQPIDILKKLFETEEVKLVAVVSHEYTTEILGMTEEDFIAHARPINR